MLVSIGFHIKLQKKDCLVYIIGLFTSPTVPNSFILLIHTIVTEMVLDQKVFILRTLLGGQIFNFQTLIIVISDALSSKNSEAADL